MLNNGIRGRDYCNIRADIRDCGYPRRYYGIRVRESVVKHISIILAYFYKC